MRIGGGGGGQNYQKRCDIIFEQQLRDFYDMYDKKKVQATQNNKLSNSFIKGNKTIF